MKLEKKKNNPLLFERENLWRKRFLKLCEILQHRICDFSLGCATVLPYYFLDFILGGLFSQLFSV